MRGPVYHISLRVLLAVLVSTAVLCSCRYKPLEEFELSTGGVSVDFDHSLSDVAPGSFRVILYPAARDDRRPLVYDVYNGQALLPTVPAGRYQAMTWNTDIEHALVRSQEDLHGAYAAVPEYSSTEQIRIAVLDSIYGKVPLYDTPDYMVSDLSEPFEVQAGKDTKVLFRPSPLTVKVDIHVTGIRGLHTVRNIRLAIGGLPVSKSVAPPQEVTARGLGLVSGWVDRSDGSVRASFEAFALPYPHSEIPAHIEALKATLFLWLEDNNVYLPLDFSEADITVSPDRRHDLISLDATGLDLNEFVAGVGAFDVNIGDWVPENIEIP